ncbi:hypothetical protein PENTCL1PPCAC_20672, partial [Pristionchus entomophagus]
MRNATYVGAAAADSVSLAAIAMLVQLIIEVKRGTRCTSPSTRRYQRLAVQSLILQGLIPTLVYVIPTYVMSGLQFAPTMFDLGAKFDRFATIFAPICWIIVTKHTFASSLTILYCSPSYRRKIFTFIIGSRSPV